MTTVATPFHDRMKSGLDVIKLEDGKYHGGSFNTGNAAYTWLGKREEFFDHALEGEDDATQKEVRGIFLPLAALLEQINKTVRKADTLSEAEIRDLEENVTVFVDLWRCNFGSCTPKMHILEAHVVPFVKKYKCIGLLGEDAGESMHALFNKLMRRARGIRNRLEKLKYVHKLMDKHQDPAGIHISAATAVSSKRNFSDPDGQKAGKKKKKKKS